MSEQPKRDDVEESQAVVIILHKCTKMLSLNIATHNNRARREELYVTLIQPAMNELVDKIVYTYKFTTLPNIEDLKMSARFG